MNSSLISLIASLVGLLIKYEPELAALGKEVILLVSKGDDITEEDLRVLQSYSDHLTERLNNAISTRLGDAHV